MMMTATQHPEAPASTGNTFFLELGTEELPPGFLLNLEAQLTEKLEAAFAVASLEGVEIQIDHTPRRVLILLSNLPEKQPDTQETIKGPPTKIAYTESGEPSKALGGFLRKNNASLEHCETETLGQETYVVLKQETQGRATRDIIGELVGRAILSLEGPRFMRWANNAQTFPRPIRWLLALWNDTPLELSLNFGEDVLRSGTLTRGHRLLGTPEFAVESVRDYFQKLEQLGKVKPLRHDRVTLIREQLEAKAAELGGRVIIEDELLDEVSVILEWPNVLVGRFDAAYLNIPRPVLITVMKAHQRYFPVENEAGELLPYFLVVTNGDPAHAETIVAGNERVLVARFEDARFFYEEDIKRPLADRVEDLAGITFQKGLGSLKDKTERVQKLAVAFADALVVDEHTKSQALRAALLCKTDLVTQMVFELTELQGEVGMHYALQQGEDATVARAIFEHYLPRFNGDELPETHAGMILSLADKLDTLAALFSQTKTKMPSGSRDPLGLRRVVNGVLLTVLLYNIQASLKRWVEHATLNLGPLAQENVADTWQRVQEFMHQRLLSYLNEKGYEYDVIQACLEAFDPWENLPHFLAKVEALSVKRHDAPDLMEALYTPANRVDKMLGKHYRPEATLEDVKPDLFQAGAERELYTAMREALSGTSTVAMMELAPKVEVFFDAVMVMSDDEAVKQNRIALLSALHSCYLNRYGRLSYLVMTP